MAGSPLAFDDATHLDEVLEAQDKNDAVDYQSRVSHERAEDAQLSAFLSVQRGSARGSAEISTSVGAASSSATLAASVPSVDTLS